MRKRIWVLLFLVMFISAVLPGFAETRNVDVLVNGQPVVSDVPSFLDTDLNRTFVPVRFVSQALGASVDWDAAMQQVIISWSGNRILLPVQSNVATIQRANNTIEKVTLDASARIVSDRTMVPLRFVSEVLGAEVVWVPLSGSVPGRVEITYNQNQPGPSEKVVIIKDFVFLPAEIIISKGETVTWINQDSAPHTATGSGFDSGYMGMGATFKFTFNEAGTFDYICTYHPYMKGKVIVN
jgi:plastocyanin